MTDSTQETPAPGHSPEVPQRLGGTAETVVNQFGPLSALIGTWMGSKGWNLVAVPNQKQEFTLLVRPYVEMLTIEALTSPTPNRGLTTIQKVPTLLYSLRIVDAITNELMHAENGTWLVLNGDPSGNTVARQASVPHGDSLLALGKYAVTPGGPQIPDINTIPVIQGVIDGYTDAYIVPTPGINKRNPNETLRSQTVTATQKVIDTLTINVSTANSGGITNIPFIVKNANTTKFAATYWIENVLDVTTGQTFQQLQYSQNTDINFPAIVNKVSQMILWPHVNINTLVKQ